MQLPFPKKGNLRITKNYRDISLTSIAAKCYNALLYCIKSEIEKILRKNQNVILEKLILNIRFGLSINSSKEYV